MTYILAVHEKNKDLSNHINANLDNTIEILCSSNFAKIEYVNTRAMVRIMQSAYIFKTENLDNSKLYSAIKNNPLIKSIQISDMKYIFEIKEEGSTNASYFWYSKGDTEFLIKNHDTLPPEFMKLAFYDRLKTDEDLVQMFFKNNKSKILKTLDAKIILASNDFFNGQHVVFATKKFSI